tara:strand:- start:219 stop:413 length:195 start_codon:yes stop_codon:yes gene_type:complete
MYESHIIMKMKIYFILLFLFILSCGYPDIDSVPSFEDIELTQDEIIDLCESETSDKIKNKYCNK